MFGLAGMVKQRGFMTYSDLLKDPRWQKKRLEIFMRDGWKCRECGRNDLELQVHHEKYFGDPWEIPNKFLKTVCFKCHACISTGIDFTSFKLITRQKFGVEICKQKSMERQK